MQFVVVSLKTHLFLKCFNRPSAPPLMLALKMGMLLVVFYP
jgi:hypothetical protein